jgi:hypothetical protein
MRAGSAHQAPPYLNPNELMYSGGIPRRIDHGASRGLRRGDLQEAAAEPFIKCAALALDGGAAAARGATAEPHLDRQIQDDGEVGL